MAQARTNLDGSNCCFNLLCVNPFVITWLVKSAYGMKQSFKGDCLRFCCLTRCYVNQIYQTTLRRGNPTSDGGAQYNLNPLSKDCCPPTCGYCCFSFWCPSCFMATALQKNIDMPYWLACCCVSPIAGQMQLHCFDPSSLLTVDKKIHLRHKYSSLPVPHTRRRMLWTIFRVFRTMPVSWNCYSRGQSCRWSRQAGAQFRQIFGAHLHEQSYCTGSDNSQCWTSHRSGRSHAWTVSVHLTNSGPRFKYNQYW